MFYQFYKQPFENNLLAKQPFGKTTFWQNNLLAKGWTKTQPMEEWNDVKIIGL
jgi:hypothetical protein